MKVALLCLALFGSALAASVELIEEPIDESEVPPFRYMHVEPIKAVSNDEPTLSIVNGVEVVPHTIPYQVYLVGRTLFNSWSCGGSLITANYVLTAAHCLQGARSIQVTLGGHNLRIPSPGQITVTAKSYAIHERYNSTVIDNDIGVIRLSTPVHPTATINYSRLPSLRDVGVNLVGRTGRVSGWGLTSGTGTGSEVLLKTSNSVITNFVCNATFGIVQNEEVCLSGAGGRSACRGDSGGPMVINDVQFGIVSYGTNGCLPEFPSVYVRITKFLHWIETHSDWRAS